MAETVENSIDFEMGKLYLGRDHDIFLKRFVEIDLQVYINKLQTLVKNLEFEELSRCSDSLYSTSAYVGAKQCQEIAKSISVNAKNNEKALIEKEIAKLIEHSDHLENILKEHFNSASGISISDPLDRITSSTLDENSPDFFSLRLRPPIKENQSFQANEREEEFDPYLEINKDWKCLLL